MEKSDTTDANEALDRCTYKELSFPNTTPCIYIFFIRMKFRQSTNLQTVETKTMLFKEGKCKGKCCKDNLREIA